MYFRRIGALRSDLRYVATLVAIASIYLATAKFGFLLAFATKQVTAVWPPTGIAFAAYVLFGYRVWPGVYIAAFLANATSHEPLVTAAGIAIGNTATGMASLFFLRRLGDFRGAPERLREVLGIVAIAAPLGCTISATGGVVNLALAKIINWSALLSVWWVWWVGDAMGVLLVAPFVLAWIREPRIRWNARQGSELGGLYVGLSTVCYLAFSGRVIETTALFRFEYAVFPFVIWAALRFGQRETTSVALIIAGFAIWGAAHGRGPFATGTLDQRLILLEVFMAVTSITALTLGAVAAEGRRSDAALKEANEQLETRVRERTAELAATNRHLAEKNEEVEAFVYIVSHDLRAPLVNLQGFSRELETSCRELDEALSAPLAAPQANRIRMILKEDIPGALHYIAASTTKFQRLIEALLTLSRFGRQEYRSEEVDVGALIRATLDASRQTITKSGAEISFSAVPKAVGDPTAIEQVFANLIANSVKYLQPGRQGEIIIGGEAVDGTAHYWVRDNGAGIPHSAKRRLFQVFQRFHPDLAPGEGMGLAIVKRVVERHGGKVWAVSEEGIGTTFHLTLPATPERNTA